MAVYICVYASLSTSRNTTYETAAYSKKHLPTLPFWAERFCILRSISDLLFVNEVFSFLFRSSFDGFCSTVRETGDPIDTTRQVARTLRTHTQRRPRPRLTGVRCRPLTKLCLAGPANVVETGGGGSSGDATEFRW